MLIDEIYYSIVYIKYIIILLKYLHNNTKLTYQMQINLEFLYLYGYSWLTQTNANPWRTTLYLFQIYHIWSFYIWRTFHRNANLTI